MNVPNEVKDLDRRSASLFLVEGWMVLVKSLPVVEPHSAAPDLEADLSSAELNVQVLVIARE